MIRLVILALALSMLSGTLGAGLAACRNWTMGSGTEADTAASASPDTPANPAAEQRNPPPTETERLWAALERERAAKRAAERRLERMAQPQAAHARPEPQPAVPAATAEPPRNEPAPAPAQQAAPIRIPSGTAVAVRTAAAVTSATARVEDTVSATTTEDITVNGRRAIPASSRMLGSVTAVERAGRMSGSDRITIRFHTLVYDGVDTSLETAPVIRTGPGQSSQNATRIGRRRRRRRHPRRRPRGPQGRGHRRRHRHRGRQRRSRGPARRPGSPGSRRDADAADDAPGDHRDALTT